MKLIVGLGNPGEEYERTRHNIGFRVVEMLAEKCGASFDRTKYKGEYASATVGGMDAVLVKPQTYMNLSGETVLSFKGFYKVELSELLVVSDDVVLPVGSLRMRAGGSDGGQRGLKDISLRLGSQEYARLRVGVGGREAGREHLPVDLASHVLSRFGAGEEEQLKKVLPIAVEACVMWAEKGVEAAMNLYNK